MIECMGMAWYTPESWRRLEAIADGELCDTYEDFVRKATRMIRGFEAQGITVEKFLINIDHMVAWCRRHGLSVDGRARSAYGAILTMHGGVPFDLDTPVDIPPELRVEGMN